MASVTAAGSVFRDDLFEGKVAFVTGGGSGICRGITEALMAHGADAVITSRKQERLDSASDALADATGRQCLGVACDVREPETVEAAFDAALARFGRVDIVVNGAAGNFLAPAAQLSYNAFKTVVSIDTLGTYNVCKAAFDRALRKSGGVIVNVSATLHYGATPLQAHAAAAKAAVDSLTRTLALEWGPLGIRVVGVAPGPIAGTEGVDRLLPKDLREKAEAKIPLRRMGGIGEIANVCVFLCSDAASLVTGETVVADGGAWLAGRSIGMD
ncbi:MAG: SDR family oxidoreductase [Myxococcota bacterium]